MENLTHLMSLIDANSEKLSEGDYLEMCNTIKNVHKHIQIYNKEENIGPVISDRIRSEDELNLENELHEQVITIEKLKDKIKTIKIRTRLSPNMKVDAIKEFVIVMGLHSLREYTEEAVYEQTNINVRQIYKWYMDEYNKRQKCRILRYSIMIEESKTHRNETISHLYTSLGY